MAYKNRRHEVAKTTIFTLDELEELERITKLWMKERYLCDWEFLLLSAGITRESFKRLRNCESEGKNFYFYKERGTYKKLNISREQLAVVLGPNRPVFLKGRSLPEYYHTQILSDLMTTAGIEKVCTVQDWKTALVCIWILRGLNLKQSANSAGYFSQSSISGFTQLFNKIKSSKI
jgi:hypothetical protein